MVVVSLLIQKAWQLWIHLCSCIGHKYCIHTWSTPFVRQVLVVQPGTPLRSWLRELFPHPPPALPAHCHDCPACSCHWCWLTLKNIMKNFGFEQYSNIHQQVDQSRRLGTSIRGAFEFLGGAQITLCVEGRGGGGVFGWEACKLWSRAVADAR